MSLVTLIGRLDKLNETLHDKWFTTSVERGPGFEFMQIFFEPQGSLLKCDWEKFV